MAISGEKYLAKRHLFVERASTILHQPPEAIESLFAHKPRQSLRINTLKLPLKEAAAKLDALNVSYDQLPWIDEGLSVHDGLVAVRDSTLNENGEVYIQNAASWLPILALDPKDNETILDMCAAPGGKTSHIVQRAQNKAEVFANDNSRPRLHKLQANLARLGIDTVTYLLHDASKLTRQLDAESFDKILLDAPCSGEGMMSINSTKDFESWSVAHIKRLQQLQKKLIVQAWNLLKPGGTLIYSTCTMAPEENEAVVDYLLRHNDDAHLEPLDEIASQLDNVIHPITEWNSKRYDPSITNVLRLAPSPSIEAFFVAKIKKAA